MALNLKKLKERLDAVQGKGKKGADTWIKLEEGDTVLRIVPDADEDPFKDYYFHYNVGKERGFLCPKHNFGEDCPVCEFASKLWRDGTEDSKKQAKALFVRQRFFANAVIRGEEDKGVRTWGFGKTVYETLMKLCLNPDYGDITDVKQGRDLSLGYGTPPGASFPKTDIMPKPKVTPVFSDLDKKETEAKLAEAPVIEDLMERKSSKEVQLVLDAWLNDSEPEGNEDVEKYPAKETDKPADEGDAVDKAFDELTE